MKERHWSLYLAGAGAVAALVIVVAGVVLQNFFVLGTGLFFLGSHVICSIYLDKFAKYKNLETYVNILTARLQEMQQRIRELMTLDQDIGHETQALKRLSEEKARQEQNYLRDLKNKQEELTKALESVDNLQAQLKKQMANAEKSMKEQAERFDHENILLKVTVDENAKKIDAYVLTELKQEQSIATFKLENEKLSQRLSQYDKENKELKTTVEALKNACDIPNIDLKKVDEQSSRLSNLSNSMQKSGVEIDSQIAKLDQIRDKISSTLHGLDIEALTEALKSVKELKQKRNLTHANRLGH
jgi:chromosome segregation ATPase